MPSVKKYPIALFLLLALPLYAEKYVIGCWDAGFFSTFLGVLNNLDWCEKNNLTPTVYWNGSCNFSCRGEDGLANGWENYFEPVSNCTYRPGDLIHSNYFKPDGTYAFYMGQNDMKSRRSANALITKYIKVKPSIMEGVNLFYDTYMRGKKTIGLHLRGTDKPSEVAEVPFERFIHEAVKHADKKTQFFIASEDLNLFDRAKSILKRKYRILSQDCIRITDPSWVCIKERVPVGEEVLVDAILLSRCDLLIHTASNVSTAALFFNPNLPSIMLSK